MFKKWMRQRREEHVRTLNKSIAIASEQIRHCGPGDEDTEARLSRERQKMAFKRQELLTKLDRE